MLRILGSPKSLCDGSTRRELLLAGGLSLLGASTGNAIPAPVVNSNLGKSFGSAKNVIVLYLFGGPSQLETFDMKPDAPVEIRGTFKPIPTSLHGLNINEHLPKVAKIMDRTTVVRSLTHPWNFHGMQWATTGLPQGSIPVEETQKHAQHWPYLGSVVSYLEQKKFGAKSLGNIPNNVILPWLLSSRRPAASYARPHGAYLGHRYDPVWTNFRGTASRSMVRMSNGPAENIADPYLGITPESRFEFFGDSDIGSDLTLDRLSTRKGLLEQLDLANSKFDKSNEGQRHNLQRQLAFNLVGSLKVRNALDLAREPASLRESYGMTLFGQGALQARRLVEAGCNFVTVVWDEVGQLNAGWDTHVDHKNRLKNDLLPGFDAAFSALILDLEQRGLLDSTLVWVASEMGRTPKLENNGDGRGHWGRAYSNILAGAGVKRGNIIGRTDRLAAEVTDRPLSAKDILATIYHLIGVNAETTMVDKLDRQQNLLPYGELVREILS